MKNVFSYFVAFAIVGIIAAFSITGCKSQCDCTNCGTEECCAKCNTEQVETVQDSTSTVTDTVTVKEEL